MTMDEAMDESKNRWSKGGRKSRVGKRRAGDGEKIVSLARVCLVRGRTFIILALHGMGQPFVCFARSCVAHMLQVDLLFVLPNAAGKGC